MVAEKKLARQDADYAINKGNNNETSIKLTDEIRDLFLLSIPSEDKVKQTVKFFIYKEDFLKSACNIMSSLPLYDKHRNLVNFKEDLCNDLFSKINTYFGTESVKEYSAELVYNQSRNSCLQGFPKEFNIRNYMVESWSTIRFEKKDDSIYMHLRFSKNKEDGTQEAQGHTAYQQIFYGAPGTGKSYAIKEVTKKYSTIRTTFHPDSDYSTFVGSYKPVMGKGRVYGAQGPLKNDKNEVIEEQRITYTFVKQAFLKAYLGAWQKYAQNDKTPRPQFLIIEEINRGNCAQIFGDLFQLLDRSDNGFSTYPIEADSDLQEEIKKAFSKDGDYALTESLDVNSAVSGYTSNYEGSTLTTDIKLGRVLLLPNNLYIWATMNTSDQSLFPIDSAFKRRWDWKYVKIADAGKSWKIRCGHEFCDWWTFISMMNEKIGKETSSDDKKLGYFFCRPENGGDVITEEQFVAKVIFYLWNDVYKDGDISIFKVNDSPEEEISFAAFYNNDNTVNKDAVKVFLKAVVGEENISW